jgi:hypothetical protein
VGEELRFSTDAKAGAATDESGQESVGVGGQQEDEHARVRLLERLKEGVGRSVVEAIGLVHEDDLATGVGAEVGEVNGVADKLDCDDSGFPRRAELMKVEMTARDWGAQVEGGDLESKRGQCREGGTVEEDGMGQPRLASGRDNRLGAAPGALSGNVG